MLCHLYNKPLSSLNGVEGSRILGSSQPLNPLMAHHYDIFREQLGTKYPSYGHALWDPSPGELYGRVEVGDVGYIREEKFHRLFNALLPVYDPSHSKFGVPEYYKPLVPNPSEHIDTSTVRSNHFCSYGITIANAIPERLANR